MRKPTKTLRKGLLTFLFLMFCSPFIHAQCDKEPEYPGLKEYMAKHITYNDSMKMHHLQGHVVLECLVDTKGKISIQKVLNEQPYGATEEAKDLINNMPAWQPGTSNGKAVKCAKQVYVYFDAPKKDMPAPPETNYAPPTEAKAEDNKKKTPVYEYADQMPSFKDYNKYIIENVKYPQEALDKGIEGLVVLKVTISETGEVSNIKVLQGQPHGLTEEAIRVIKMMPRWKPGKMDGTPVAVETIAQIRFQLANDGRKKRRN